MDPRTRARSHHLRRPVSARLRSRWHRATAALTASVTSGGMMLLGVPVALDYVVRPGDTLSEIAQHHDTSIERLVARNDLHRSGDQVVAGQTLRIPAAHGRSGGGARSGSAGGRISPDARKIVRYTVRPGDTPSGLAVRFRAWTAEIVERNGAVLHVGEQIEIPVVLAAVAEDRRSAARPSTPSAPDRASSRRSHTGPSRATVRRVIAATARRHGVDPDLALAVSWQEAGWQMHHVSSAKAIGAMQILPSTGEWMSDVVGRELDLRDLRDNATAGVVLLDLLEQQAASTRRAVAGYYQGLAGVRKHGMYDDTKRYVANVMALEGRFERGLYPE